MTDDQKADDQANPDPVDQKTDDQKTDDSKADDQKVADQKADDQGKPKDDGDKTGADKDGGKDDPAKQIPDEYELVTPEGLEKADLDGIVAIAKQLKLTNEQAQAGADMLPHMYKADRDRFLVRTEAHPEVGGDHHDAAKQNVLRFVDKWLPATEPEGEELRRGLTVNGFGNWTPLVLMLSRAGKEMAEDPGIGMKGADKKATRKTDADALFGDAAGVQPIK